MDTETASSVHTPNPFQPYQLMLQESTHHFISELQKPHPDFSCLSSIFCRLVKTMFDPPLEIVWFHAAVNFRSGTSSAAEDPSVRLLAVKDLFQVLVSCSVSCSGTKRIALLAPLVSKLIDLVNLEGSVLVRADIDGFLEGIASYICICCFQDSECDNGSVPLTSSFIDSVRLWTVDRRLENWEVEGSLKSFFPLIGGGMFEGFGAGSETGYLAGFVMTEVVLLKLCFKFHRGGSTADLHKDMLCLAENSMNGFRNHTFFDIILRTLLDPILPVTSLVSLEDEVLMRGVLYDSVIMVDYSFLFPQNGIQMPTDDLKYLAITWLFVAEDAVQFLRKHGDQAKIITYTDAFTQCHLFYQLYKWVGNMAGKVPQRSDLVATTPNGLIRLLLTLEAQGAGVFDGIAILHKKAILYRSRVMQELSVVQTVGKNREESVGRPVDAMLLESENLTGTSGRRKREGGEIESNIQAKLVKYQFNETPKREKYLSCSEDGSSCGSEMAKFIFDEGMKDMELQ